jgi:hypothetical protein
MARIKSDKLARALHDFLEQMENRLEEKESEGKSGWARNDWKEYILRELLEDASALKAEGSLNQYQKLLIDIANRCMMLWYQNNKSNPSVE